MSREGASRIPAGEFSDWLLEIRRAIADEGAMDVPCGDCRGCCVSSHFVLVRPDEAAALSRIDPALLFRTPGMQRGHRVMAYREDGTCPQMDGGNCAIYPDRPRACRTYDCRVFAAAGIPAGGDDNSRIQERVSLWRFEYRDDASREAHRSVGAAASFVSRRPELFPGGAVPRDPGQLAVLALKCHEVFLPGAAGDRPESGDRRDASVADSVVEAVRRFDARAESIKSSGKGRR